MKKSRLFGLTAVITTFLFAGCSDTVETGPVPSITPKPMMTSTPAPVVTEEPTAPTEENVYETKRFKEYYEETGELPQLYRAYEGLFTIGLDALQVDVTDAKRQAVVKQQFNSISCKKDLSPDTLMDYEATRASGDLTRIALDFSGADVILKFAQENNLPVRGPRLITNETPAWAFTKDFSEDQIVTITAEDGTETTTIEYASADIMLARMENYIKDVITYCNTNYPGLVVTWDVLDDIINTGENHALKYRESSYWHQTIGEEYIIKACEFARKYAAENQKLFYSQDALDEVACRNAAAALIDILKKDNLIDGVAIQAHYAPGSPNVFLLNDTFKKIYETGLEIHITEFYADSNDGNSKDDDYTFEELLERVAKRYKNLMTTFVGYDRDKSYDIVSITFEGLSDDTSSLNEPVDYIDVLTGEVIHGVRRESYPYIFDKDFKIKELFFAALGDVTIKGY